MTLSWLWGRWERVLIWTIPLMGVLMSARGRGYPVLSPGIFDIPHIPPLRHIPPWIW